MQLHIFIFYFDHKLFVDKANKVENKSKLVLLLPIDVQKCYCTNKYLEVGNIMYALVFMW